MVRERGKFICTFYCRDGQVCDNANMRCLPGPGLTAAYEKAKEDARKSTLAYNHSRVKSERKANSHATGHDLGSTYYKWDGDPRVIPTPRHRQGGYFSSFSKRPANYSRVMSRPVLATGRSGRIVIPSGTRDQVLPLVTAARSFSTNDPNRAGAVKLLRRHVRDKKIPIDVDELLGCGTTQLANASQHRVHELR